MLPTLVVVSGPSGGYGKTTLAHEIARAIGCPAICRDEIKEGMVHAAPPGFQLAPGDRRRPPDPLTQRTFEVFFDVLAVLLGAGATVVAEAAFQGPVWAPRLERLSAIAEIRVIRCVVDPLIANERNQRRAALNPRRARAHPRKPGPLPAVHPFEAIGIGTPSISVDTTDGYAPELADIVAFVGSKTAGAPEASPSGASSAE
ncbi:AAA family ATPase [Actinopolymorpha singaporensis]